MFAGDTSKDKPNARIVEPWAHSMYWSEFDEGAGKLYPGEAICRLIRENGKIIGSVLTIYNARCSRSEITLA